MDAVSLPGRSYTQGMAGEDYVWGRYGMLAASVFLPS